MIRDHDHEQEKQPDPKLDRMHHRIYILRIIEIPLIIILVLFFTFDVLTLKILPSQGINFMTHLTGESMYPSLKEGMLIVWKDKNLVPFEEVLVGDIIIFRERPEHSDSLHDPSPSPDADPDEPERYEDRDIQYVEEKHIVHRVTRIVPDSSYSDRALFTEGDHNGYEDPVPVLESGYIGKLVWFNNTFCWMFTTQTMAISASIAGGLFLIVSFWLIIEEICVFNYTRRKEKNHLS